MRKKRKATTEDPKGKSSTGEQLPKKFLRDDGELGDEQTIKIIIHYGGKMEKQGDDYKYIGELGKKIVFWKFEEIEWAKFGEFSRFEGVYKTVQLIWYKRTCAEMRTMDYVFDICDGDMPSLSGLAYAAGEIEVFLEQDHEDTKLAGDGGCNRNVDDDGYDPDDERVAGEDYDSDDVEMEDEDDRPPMEDVDPEDSEDERPAMKGHENEHNDLVSSEEEICKVGKISEIDDGDEVVIDAGKGGDDERFLTVFEEGGERDPVVDQTVLELLQEQENEAKEAADEESDPEFGLDDVMYPDTPLESDEEWEQWKNPKKEKRKSNFNGHTDQEPYLWLFQTFNSGLQFKDQLLRYSLNTQHDIKMAKSEENRIAAVCKIKTCNWRVFCSIEKPLNKWMVKVCHIKHNHGSSSKVSMLKQGVIAGLFREEIRRNINLSAADIKYIIKEWYDIVVNKSKCFKARRIALDSILEAQMIQFGKLWDYEAELKRSNNGISSEIITAENNGRQQFQGFYICFKELRETWHKWCRPIIRLDGCFLKWDLEGYLLAAVGRDADNKMYPIAWAVVTGENKDTWGWFIQKLKVDLELGVGKNLTVISDKQKGLIHAMGVELPQAEHRMCARHIYANWKKSFSKSEYKNLFWSVAYSYHEGEYKEKMKIVQNFDPTAYDALLKTDPVKWCRAFFDPHSRCADVHNNLSEAFNRTIKMARTKPVITMLEDIRRQAMSRISRRWWKAKKIDSFLTPIIMDILEKGRVGKKYCKTIRSSTNLFEVTEYDTVGYTVDLAAHQCACRRWDLTGIPCKHAICVFDDNEQDPEKFVSEYYEASALKKTYEENIKPVNGEKMWLPTDKPPISIPDIRKPRGRPKTRNRRKEPFEDLKNPGKSTRHGRLVHCSQCGQQGHIKSGCKNDPVVVEGPKNRRGRPRKNDTEALLQPKPNPPKTKKTKASTKPAQPTVSSKKTKKKQSSGSQPLLSIETPSVSSTQLSMSVFPASSSAPQPSVSSNKPKTRKRGRPPLKTKTVENTPRGVGMLASPFTGKPFQVYGDKIYHHSPK